MKKIGTIILLSLFVVLGMTACYEDESSLGTIEVGKIEIADLQDMSVVSYSDNVLHIEPDVKAGYPEEEMRYAWYIHGGEFLRESITKSRRRSLISCAGNTLSAAATVRWRS